MQLFNFFRLVTSINGPALDEKTAKAGDKSRKALTGHADQSQEGKRQGREAQHNDFPRKGQRKLEYRQPDAAQENRRLDGVSQLEHPAQDGAGVDKIGRDHVGIEGLFSLFHSDLLLNLKVSRGAGLAAGRSVLLQDAGAAPSRGRYRLPARSRPRPAPRCPPSPAGRCNGRRA